MSARLIIIIILVGLTVLAHALSGKPHDFNFGECNICHPAVKIDPMRIYPDITGSCQKCHTDLNEIQMHPTDIIPKMRIPLDMPLFKKKLTCLTCHFAHPEKKHKFMEKNFFLRRSTKGRLFCSTCHTVDNVNHVVLDNAHIGKYIELDPDLKIDFLSLSCLKCHENTINKNDLNSIGAGIWNHPDRVKINHPIGINYEKFCEGESSKNYFPVAVLKIKLFDGKIGCGTCHSITSKRGKILVMEQTMLCRQCHNR